MKNKHLNKIDALRGIAIILVITFHTLLILFPGYEIHAYSDNGLISIEDSKKFILNFNPIGQGWIGVELFILISGFLIHYIYLQNQKEFKWSSFFSKRFWRIYPPYFVVMFFIFLHRPDITIAGFKNLLSHIFLLHNLNDKTFFGINPSFWSIALEVQLYLLYPIYLMMIKYFKPFKTTAILFIFTIIFCVISLILGVNSNSFNTNVFKFWFVWGIGAFLADKYYYNKRIFNKPFLWFILFYILFFSFKLYFITNYFILIPATLSCLAFVEMILYSNIFEKYLINRLIFKLLSFTGIISYSLYLTHQAYLGDLLSFYNPKTNFIIINNIISISFTYITFYIISYSLYLLLELKSIEIGKYFRK
jgi:peptidoglycan/LPS O-acetylase OafA/YrhL